MAKFQIRAALSGGFGGVENACWETVECSSMAEAESEAYEAACAVYDSYDGLHGLRSIEQIMEEAEVSEHDAEEIWREEREGWLDYEAREYAPEDPEDQS